MFRTLITAELLQHFLESDYPRTYRGKPIMVFDCTYDFFNPQIGQQQFDGSHIPGAIYVKIDTHLSAKNDPTAVSGGRHPLPSRENFAAWLSSIGFTNGHQAIVYDRNDMNFCGRLWWMLKWVGHDAVAILDGSLDAWNAIGGALANNQTDSASKTKPGSRSNFVLGDELCTLATIDTVASSLHKPNQTLLDARAPARFRGEVEPLDPVAGHIPGALNRPLNANLDADGKFKPANVLKSEFAQLLAGRDPSTVVHHCSSGVRVVPNLLAMELAGFGRQALFAGSWSEWCSDPRRPVARG
jgi:thiosulfate/3-mercaptopyruvate sulfurtransferase